MQRVVEESNPVIGQWQVVIDDLGTLFIASIAEYVKKKHLEKNQQNLLLTDDPFFKTFSSIKTQISSYFNQQNFDRTSFNEDLFDHIFSNKLFNNLSTEEERLIRNLIAFYGVILDVPFLIHSFLRAENEFIIEMNKKIDSIKLNMELPDLKSKIDFIMTNAGCTIETVQKAITELEALNPSYDDIISKNILDYKAKINGLNKEFQEAIQAYENLKDDKYRLLIEKINEAKNLFAVFLKNQLITIDSKNKFTLNIDEFMSTFSNRDKEVCSTVIEKYSNNVNLVNNGHYVAEGLHLTTKKNEEFNEHKNDKMIFLRGHLETLKQAEADKERANQAKAAALELQRKEETKVSAPKILDVNVKDKNSHSPAIDKKTTQQSKEPSFFSRHGESIVTSTMLGTSAGMLTGAILGAVFAPITLGASLAIGIVAGGLIGASLSFGMSAAAALLSDCFWSSKQTSAPVRSSPVKGSTSDLSLRLGASNDRHPAVNRGNLPDIDRSNASGMSEDSAQAIVAAAIPVNTDHLTTEPPLSRSR